MNKHKFLVLGNVWAKTINKKLINLSFDTFFIKIERLNLTKINEISKIINKVKFDYCWIATNPNENYKIIKILLLNKVNLIIEKPILLSKKQYNILNNIRIKNKLIIVINFQFLFLSKLKRYDKKAKNVGFVFKSKKKI